MKKYHNFVLTCLLFLIIGVEAIYPPWIRAFSTNHHVPWHNDYFCKGNDDIVLNYEEDAYHTYDVWVNEVMEPGTEITVKFDAEVSISFIKTYGTNVANEKFTKEPDTINNVFTFEFTNKSESLRPIFRVEGNTPQHQIHVISLRINGIEKCHNPDLEVFRSSRYYRYLEQAPDKFCGRRRVNVAQNPLIVSGSSTEPGWWPWHAAIYKIKKDTLTYICGGTLISKHLVLTAAHCVTVNGAPVNPEVLGVVLGKFSLFGSDITAQSMEVYKVIVHEEFYHRHLNNDIALVKLMTAASFNNYVQPACLWFDGIYDTLDSYEITGSVVGWGFDRKDTLTKTLNVATMPIVPDVTCILFQPIFYHRMLNGKKFCAGHQNGTSPCNGDSGGGYVVYVEDYKPIPSDYIKLKKQPGAYYVRGIVSVTLKSNREDQVVCDPNGYTVFTDVAKYRDWILNHMKNNQ